MKKIITILSLFIAFVSNAQRTMFAGNNNYKAPVLLFSGPLIVTNGLVSYLDAGNPLSYNGSGSTWTDLTGNGNNVTLTNTGYSSVNGGGIALNTNGYGTQTLANSPFNGDFTWTTIFRYNEGMWDWIYNVDNYSGLILTAVSNKPALSWGGWYNNKINANAESPLINGNYYMLTFVRSGNAITCYVQATTYGTGSNVSGNINLVSPLIGKGPGGEAWPNGIVNLILLYDRALTQTEITQNYIAYSSRFGF
jgi:Concanavalin A-like lectin/glucanases superfamily